MSLWHDSLGYQQVLGQPELHSETLLKAKQQTNKKEQAVEQ